MKRSTVDLAGAQRPSTSSGRASLASTPLRTSRTNAVPPQIPRPRPRCQCARVTGLPAGRVGRFDRQRLLDAKFEQGFTGHPHLLAMSEDLDSRACTRANARADRSALAATGNRADDGTKGRAAAHLLGSVSAARLPGHIIITGDNRMQFLVDEDIGQFELQLRFPRDMAGPLSLCQAAVDVGALRRDDGISYREVLFQTGAEFVSDPVLLRVHAINHAHEYPRPRRDCDALRVVSAFARGRPHPRCEIGRAHV